MQKPGTRSSKTILLMILLGVGASLIAFATIVDLLNLNHPIHEFITKHINISSYIIEFVRIFILIVGIWFLVISLLILFNVVRSDYLESVSSKLKHLVLTQKIDIINGFILLCGCVIFGIYYKSAVHPYESDLFYQVTLKSRIFEGHFYIYGILFGIVISISYCIFRLGMGRFLSFICAVGFSTSPIHLYNLIPSLLRDYAKAPFILFFVLIVGIAVTTSLNRNKLFILSAIAGVVIGLGLVMSTEN